ncbi:MAG: hypothetical protein GC178_18665 [Flavobacteriales bacterium]|nr:hypothetical protein [Flavobacteriales bacterium]
MPNYTFTTASSYALSTHEVSFTKTTITIKLTSTGQTVYSKAYDGGLAFMCSGNDFCVGTLNDNGVFSKTVDFGNRQAAMWVEEASGANKFIGSNNVGDEGIYNNYVLNTCPVRLVNSTGGNYVTIECPCESSSGTCTNSCYSYGS